MEQTRWTDAFLDPMRRLGDETADRVVQEVAQEGGTDAVLLLLRRLIQQEEVSEGEPQVVRDFFARTAALPAFADPALIRRGEMMFERYGPQVLMLLSCYSLPAAYAARRGVQVLHFTARLSREPVRRLLATTQMVADMLTEGGMGPGGRGVLGCQKVRLLHATIRYQIAATGPAWDPDFGVPINQEDLGGTLTTFSHVILDGLKKLEMEPSPEDQAAYLHVWQVAAHLLGLLPEMVPRDLADAADLAESIRRRQFAKSPEGQEMTAALVKMMQEATPGLVFNGLPPTLMRHFLGDEVADMVGVPPADYERHFAVMARMLNWTVTRVENRSTMLGRVCMHFATAYLQGMLWVDRGGQRGQMCFSDKLRAAWKMMPI